MNDQLSTKPNDEGADTRKDSVRQARDTPCDALSSNQFIECAECGGMVLGKSPDGYVTAEDFRAERAENERLRAALTSIAAPHIHPPVDERGYTTLLQSDCPACTPRTTALEALRSADYETFEVHSDTLLLDWVLQHVSGKEWRRLGIVYGDGMTREALRAAVKAGESL